MVHVFEGMVQHDKIVLTRHFEQIFLQDFQVCRILKVILQKWIYAGEISEPAPLHRQYDPTGPASNIKDRSVKPDQIGFHPGKWMGQKQGDEGAYRIKFVQIMPQQTLLEEIDDWIQGQAKFRLPERVIFGWIIL